MSLRMRDSRKKGVQHSLSGQQRVIGGQLLCDGSHLSDGPHLHHGELLPHPLKLQLHHHVLTQRHTHGINTKQLLHSCSRRCGGLTLTSYCPGGAT